MEDFPKKIESNKEQQLDNLSVDVQIVREKLEKLLSELEAKDGLDPEVLRATIQTAQEDLWKIQQSMVEIAHK